LFYKFYLQLQFLPFSNLPQAAIVSVSDVGIFIEYFVALLLSWYAAVLYTLKVTQAVQK